MRCGVCGAKVGSTVLGRVVARPASTTGDGLMLGLDTPDDAAVLAVPDGKLLVQSVDYFGRSSTIPICSAGSPPTTPPSDPVRDGGNSHTRHWRSPASRSGVSRSSNRPWLSWGSGGYRRGRCRTGRRAFQRGCGAGVRPAANGFVDPTALLPQGGSAAKRATCWYRPSHSVPAGTLLAADMRGRAKGRWIDGAIASMLLSNRAAATCVQRFGASALH